VYGVYAKANLINVLNFEPLPSAKPMLAVALLYVDVYALARTHTHHNTHTLTHVRTVHTRA